MSNRAAFPGFERTADWRIKHHFNFLFEIATRDIAHLLPRQLRPVEPSLGLSLLNIGYMKLHAGNLAGLPEFDEITFSIQVGADLSVGGPVPRFAFYDLRIGSNCREFLEFEETHQELNGSYSNLVATVSDECDEVRVIDDDGPIFLLRNTNPQPRLKSEHAVGQYYSSRADGLYHGVFQWEGSGFEHQREGDAGRLFNHPFFREIDVALVRDCHTQMFLAPLTEATLYSYRPRKLASGG